MPKGSRVHEGKKLKTYSTKLEEDFTQQLARLAQVQNLDGQRELLHRMYKAYTEKHPQDAAKAEQLAELLGANE